MLARRQRRGGLFRGNQQATGKPGKPGENRGRLSPVPPQITIERQCENEFIKDMAEPASKADAIVSFGCGAGVQALAERFPGKPVYPALNTQFLGILEEQAVWTEKCLGCGDCVLAQFGGICPVTRCAKRLLNGPCGGSHDGHCEVNPDLDCAWQLIYERAKATGTLESLSGMAAVHDWSTGLDGGPRKVVREDQRIAGLGPKA